MNQECLAEPLPAVTPPTRIVLYGPSREGALDDAIEERAFQAFRERGRVDGHDQEDWDLATWLVIAETLG